MINYDLRRIRAVIFDVDGVLSAATTPMHPCGEAMRTVNTKDGYAMQLAVRQGIAIAIISGATTESIRARHERLGIRDIYLGSSRKILSYEDFLARHGLDDSEVIYMGDDIPDLEAMRRAGCPCCPSDACPDIKEASVYISDRAGGHGCARDVLEQVLRAQGKWLASAEAFGW